MIIFEPDEQLLISQYITSIIAKYRDFEYAKEEYTTRIYPVITLDYYSYIIKKELKWAL
jgi:hypothetical protein